MKKLEIDTSKITDLKTAIQIIEQLLVIIEEQQERIEEQQERIKELEEKKERAATGEECGPKEL